MFFGNRVTCDYWDYVWLNEGFASYLEYLIADKVIEFRSGNIAIDLGLGKAFNQLFWL